MVLHEVYSPYLLHNSVLPNLSLCSLYIYFMLFFCIVLCFFTQTFSEFADLFSISYFKVLMFKINVTCVCHAGGTRVGTASQLPR